MNQHEHHQHHQHHHNQHDHHSHHGNHGGDEHDAYAHHSPDAFKRKFWLSLLLAIPTVIFSHTIQEWFGYELAFTGSEYIAPIFGVVIFFYGGWVFITSAIDEIKNRQPGMMTLIAMAISVAFVYSAAVTLGLIDGMDMWWELATLVVIMLLGHWIEMASVHKASSSLQELAKLLPDEAEIVHGKETYRVPIAELKVDDLIIIRPGAKIAADGVVAKGESKVNESMLTGESKPVLKKIKSQVIGGTINGSGALTVRVTSVGGDTALAGIMKLVGEAQSSKSKTQVLADRAAFYLTFVAIAAAIITLVAWWLAGESAQFIIERVVTVLVIACPHALGLAIPLVTAISTTLAAQRGVLVRERLALESARNVDVVLFDKTGTLTRGEQGVVDVVSVGDEKDMIAKAAAVEAQSEHSIARAIVDYAKSKRLKLPNATKFDSLPGRGVAAHIDGKQLYVGGPALLAERGVKVDDEIEDAASKADKDGKTVVYVIDGNEVIGALMLADVIRDESKQAVADLRAMSKRVALLTGDSKGVAKWVAGELGIDEYHAEVLPSNKADVVKQLQQSGARVAMVGDGVNDAPALVQADVGIAIGAGTDAAIESAGIILASNNPQGVASILRLSRATYRKMIQNLWWAAGYNIVALPLAAGVLAPIGVMLSPAAGAVLMSLSTIIVALNAQLLRRS